MSRTRTLAAAAALATALTASGATAAWAAYPPNPLINGSSSASVVAPGGSASFTFGTAVPFLPGAAVAISSVCTAADGSTFAGPATSTTADAAGLAYATFTFTQAGSCVVTAVGPGAAGEVTASAAITVTGGATPVNNPADTRAAAGTGPGSGPGAGSGSGTGAQPGSSGSLATTGANNVAAIAALGGGLPIAGVGAVTVARRRERAGS